MLANAEVTRFLTWPAHATVEVSRQVISSWIEEAKDDKNYQWCIELKEIHEAIGSIGIVHLKKDIDAVEVGYCIGKAY